MDYSSRDEEWKSLISHLQSNMKNYDVNSREILWLILAFCNSRLHPPSENLRYANHLDFASFLRGKLQASAEKNFTFFESHLSAASDDALVILDGLLDKTFDHLDKTQLIDLTVYLIDSIISKNLRYEPALPRVYGEVIKSLIEKSSHPSIVEIFPTNGEHSSVADKYDEGEKYLVMRSQSTEMALVGLKLKILNVNHRFISEHELLQHTEPDTTYIIDFDQADISQSGKTYARLPAIKILQDFLRMRKPGRLIVITKQSRNGTEQHVSKLLKTLLSQTEIETIIKLPVPSLKNASRGILIVARSNNPKRSTENKTLHIDVTRSELISTGISMLECANLAGNIYRLWSGLVIHHEKSPSAVRRIINSQFSDRYHDIPGICIAAPLIVNGIIETAPWKTHDAAEAEPYRPSLLINSRPIIEQLTNSQYNRCFYVIGNNGEGKSFLLKDIIHLMALGNQKTIAISISQADRFPHPEDVKGEFYSRAGAAASSNSNSLNIRSAATSSAIVEAMKKDKKAKLLLDSLTELGFDKKIYLIKRSRSGNQSAASGSVLSLTAHRENIEFSDIDPKSHEIGIVARGEDKIIPFKDLSSGERNILQLTALLIESAQPDITFFIDEPEISLHVKWQQSLPKLFSRIAETFGLSFVVATHSPVIIANANFDNSDCYIARDGILKIIDPNDRHSVETILLQGFHTYTPHNREVHEKCAKLVSNVIQLVNTDEENAKSSGEDAIMELANITTIIDKTGQNNGNAQERGDLELITKAITAIRSVIRTR